MKSCVSSIERNSVADSLILRATPGRELLNLGVHCYRDYFLELNQPRRRLEVPEGHVTVLLGCPMGLRVSTFGENSTGAATYRSLIAGPRTQSKIIEHDGCLRGMEVVLAPPAAFTLLGPMGDLVDEVLNLQDFPASFQRRLIYDLAGKLMTTSSAHDRFDLVEKELSRLAGSGVQCTPWVQQAWDQLINWRGNIRIDILARRLNCTENGLRNKFKKELGICPKKAASVMQVQCALRLMENGKKGIEAAAEAGFCDQSHLIKVCKRVTGFSPRELFSYRNSAAVGSLPRDRVDGQITSVLLAKENV